MSDAPALPRRALLEAQSNRLSGMRSRILRRIGIAHRGPTLDLGAGYGSVTGELARRARGPVVALDRDKTALAVVESTLAVKCVLSEAPPLPFDDGSFDLVFAQCFFLWNPDLGPSVADIHRVLRPGGVLFVIEPDYGGLMEHPPEIALGPVWRDALRRAGGDPLVGRKVPVALAAAGFDVRVDLSPTLAEAQPDRFELLAGLPLTEAERRAVEAARSADTKTPFHANVTHLPHVFATGTRT